MKYVSLAFLIMLFACKSAQKMNADVLKGRLVVNELCGHYIVELISGQMDTAKLAVDWHDEKRNTTYKQSFSIKNVCSFGKAALKEGDVFSFKVDSDTPPEVCAVCMAYYPTPQQSVAVKEINKITP
ncbi:MAG: hypothetical protein QM802_09070 [Agriterribacter sp.]